MQVITRFPLMLGGALAAAALLLAGAAKAQQAERTARTLTLIAEGTATAAPDIATISLGVVSEAEAAAAALSDNTRRMREIAAELKDRGIAERDLQTSNISVQPVYANETPRRSNEAPAPPRVVAYRASNLLTVRIRDLTKVGAILDATVGVGANSVSGPVFTVDDPEPHQDAARRAAIANARANAALYAEAAGIALGPVTSIEEQNFGGPQPYAMARAAAMEAAADVPIEGGELTFRANVRVVWEIAE